MTPHGDPCLMAIGGKRTRIGRWTYRNPGHPSRNAATLLGTFERGRATVVRLAAIARASGFGDARRHPFRLTIVAFTNELEHRCLGDQAR
jgi:hypothetical protein